MTDIELVFVDVTSTCQTDGCENSGIPIEIQAVEGQQVMCGCCGQFSQTIRKEDG